jgi:hypothetical protein
MTDQQCLGLGVRMDRLFVADGAMAVRHRRPGWFSRNPALRRSRQQTLCTEDSPSFMNKIK